MSPALPRVDILMVGRTLPLIEEHYGDFDRWFQERPGAPASFQVHFLFDGDPLPAASGSDGWIVTGSSDSVNDELPWLPATREGLARAVDEGHPVLGICFGHQLLAVSAGGRVKPNPRGWELGSAVVNLTSAGASSPIFQGMGSRIPVFQSHREVVASLPPGARVLATNDMGLQAFQIGREAFGVQFHPEFTAEITRRYVELRSGHDEGVSVGPEARGEDSRQVLTNFIQYMTR